MKIGDLCEVVRGSSPRPKSDPRYYGGTVPRLMVADLTRDGKIVSARIDSLTELGAKQSRLMQQGDMVIAVSGAPGLPAILAHEACIHDGFVGLRNLNLKRVCPNFLYSYLTFIRATSNSQAVGAIFKNLTTDQIKRIDIPELPLEEQRRIAEILDRAEELRSKRREAIAQLDTLTQAIFIEMFGDPVTNPKGWTVSKLGDIAEKITDGEHQTPKRTLQGIKLLSARNVQNGYIDVRDVDYVSIEEYERIMKRCNPVRGDILLSCSGTIGRVTTVDTDEPFSLVRSVALLKLKHDLINSRFLEYFLRTPALHAKMQQRANASSQANLFQNQIRELPAFIPPLTLQQEFAHRVEAVEKLKAAHRASLSELDALFASLQHRAFRGEL
jgi:type I restriction enzyme S subunit